MMKIDLTVEEVPLLMELIQDWKKTHIYNKKEVELLNGIVKKIYDSWC